MNTDNIRKLTIMAFILLQAFYQVNAQGTFEKIFGGFGREVGGYLCKTSDGGYMIGADKGPYNRDLWLIKTNADGDTSWTKTIDLGANEYCKYIRQTEDLGYFIAGLQRTNNYDNGSFFIKTDAYGSPLWYKNYSFFIFSEGVPTQDGGFIAVGNDFSGWTGYIVKLDSNGDTLWTRSYYDPLTLGHLGVYSITEGFDNTFMIAGMSPLGWGQLFPDFAFASMINSSGDSLWYRQLNIPMVSNFAATSICRSDNGIFVIAGTDFNYPVYYAVDTTGNIVWHNYVYLSFWELNSGPPFISIVSEGGYILSAPMANLWYQTSKKYNLIARLNESGDTIWTRKDYDRHSTIVFQTDDMGFVTTGSTLDDNGHHADVWLLKTNEEGLLTNVYENNKLPYSGTLNLTTNPNPFQNSSILTFYLPIKQHVSIVVADNHGREIKVVYEGILDAGRHDYQFDASGFKPGIYYGILRTEQSYQTIKILRTL